MCISQEYVFLDARLSYNFFLRLLIPLTSFFMVSLMKFMTLSDIVFIFRQSIIKLYCIISLAFL